MVNRKAPPERDIGPVYKVFVTICFGGVLYTVSQASEVRLHDLILVGIVALMWLSTMRILGLDALVKEIAHRIPFLKFSKEE